ncbi:hypothetical protein ACWEPC_50310 [Nonomuraea sp. NPDC004297]
MSPRRPLAAALTPATAAHAGTYTTEEHWDYAGSGDTQREYRWTANLVSTESANQTHPVVCIIHGKINGRGGWPYLQWTEISGTYTVKGPNGETVSGTFPTSRWSVSDNQRGCSWGSDVATYQPGRWTLSVSVNLHGYDDRLFNRPTDYYDSFTYDDRVFEYTTG